VERPIGMRYTQNDWEKIVKVTGIAFNDYLKGMRRLRRQTIRALKNQRGKKT